MHKPEFRSVDTLGKIPIGEICVTNMLTKIPQSPKNYE